MGDFLVDDWESLVDKDIEEIKAANNVVEPVKEQQLIPVPVNQPEEKAETKKEKKNNAKETVVIEQPKQDKPKPLTNEEKRKAELLSRLATDNLIDDLFEGLSIENKKTSASQIVLKNEKNFEDFAKTVAERFDEQTPEEYLADFCVELLIQLYPQMVSQELRQVQEKVTILKNEKKKEDKKKKKEVKKEVKKQQPKAEERSEEKSESSYKDLRYVPGMEDFM